jgi:Zn-dependent peptidase ImmA (M78 family)/DNA-binding XRE family transcriptional regulator
MKCFNSIRLSQARRWRGYSLDYLAGKLDVSKASISLYEKGARKPDTFIQVKLSEALHFPLNFFYTEPDDVSSFQISYRKKANIGKAEEVKSNLIKQFAHDLVELIQENISFKESSIKPLEIDWKILTNENIENFAKEFRKDSGASSGAILELMTFLENRGVFIFLYPNEISSADGFSCVINSRPYIFINKDKSWDRIRYSTAHELGHILLHSADDKENRSKDDSKNMELQANYFASAFLLPEEIFRNEFVGLNRDFIFKMKLKWGVSMQAIAYRAKSLNLISDAQYESFFIQLSKRGERTKEPGEDIREKEHPFVIKTAIESIIRNTDRNKEYLRSRLALPDELLDILSYGVLSDIETEKPNKQFIFKIK